MKVILSTDKPLAMDLRMLGYAPLLVESGEYRLNRHVGPWVIVADTGKRAESWLVALEQEGILEAAYLILIGGDPLEAASFLARGAADHIDWPFSGREEGALDEFRKMLERAFRIAERQRFLLERKAPDLSHMQVMSSQAILDETAQTK